MAFQQRFGTAELGEDLIVGHGRVLGHCGSGK